MAGETPMTHAHNAPASLLWSSPSRAERQIRSFDVGREREGKVQTKKEKWQGKTLRFTNDVWLCFLRLFYLAFVSEDIYLFAF